MARKRKRRRKRKTVLLNGLHVPIRKHRTLEEKRLNKRIISDLTKIPRLRVTEGVQMRRGKMVRTITVSFGDQESKLYVSVGETQHDIEKRVERASRRVQERAKSVPTKKTNRVIDVDLEMKKGVLSARKSILAWLDQ